MLGGKEIAEIVALAFLGVIALGKWIIHPMLNSLIAHRRELAGLGSPEQVTDRKEVERLEAEIRELKDRLNAQEILLDDQRYRQIAQEESRQAHSS